jgi:prenyltransferase beta subunit
VLYAVQSETLHSISADKTPPHHQLNNYNHTENMETGRSVIFNLTFPAQKAPSPWQTNVTCNSLWTIRIRNMSQFPTKKFKTLILATVNESPFCNIQGHFGGFHS